MVDFLNFKSGSDDCGCPAYNQTCLCPTDDCINPLTRSLMSPGQIDTLSSNPCLLIECHHKSSSNVTNEYNCSEAIISSVDCSSVLDAVCPPGHEKVLDYTLGECCPSYDCICEMVSWKYYVILSLNYVITLFSVWSWRNLSPNRSNNSFGYVSKRNLPHWWNRSLSDFHRTAQSLSGL